MRAKVGILGCLILGVAVFTLSGYSLAEEVKLEGIIARIPEARILDWKGTTPTVDGKPAWQEQALSKGNEVCCTGACIYVDIALNRSGDNVARLLGGCMTINTIEKEAVSSISQSSGLGLFGVEVLSEGSKFEVETPDATIGVTGTIFGTLVVGFPSEVFTLAGLLEGKLKVRDIAREGYSDPDDGEEVDLMAGKQHFVFSNLVNHSELLGGQRWSVPPGRWKKLLKQIAEKAKRLRRGRGHGQEPGHGPGYGQGQGPGHGQEPGHGSGYGHGPGYGHDD